MLDQISQPSEGGRPRPQATAAAALLALVFLLGFGEGAGGGPVQSLAAERADNSKRCLRPERLREAKRWAAGRDGSVGFAFADECGRLVGAHRNRVYSSASVVKVMLLAAYLRRREVSGRPLSGGEQDLLGSMITMSSNKAANQVFVIVGEGGLEEVADEAGMSNFVSSSSWGGSGITAADQAAFLGRLESYIPKRHEDFVAKLLSGVIPHQTWGIADVRPEGWELAFKGGWYGAPDGWRVNQVARLTQGRRSFSLAVLTDGNASFQYGRETIEGVAKRLMDDYRR